MIDEYNDDRTGWARFSDDRTMRFRLARSLDSKPLEIEGGIVAADLCVTFAMLNPSKADAFKPDPTVTRGMSFARAFGADVYQAVNIHPVMSTDPDGMYEWANMPAPEWREIQRINNEEIRLACVGAKVIAAWGTHGAFMAQGNAVREFLQREGKPLFHLGLTKHGHPKHPLYLKGGTEPQLWSAP